MKIQCDVCEKAPATVICCADEAALCTGCDVEIHAANKLASKHQRLDLQYLPGKPPRCDICQEKTAFIFCVEDRALFCRECDESIHVARSHSGIHQRFLATGIRVAPIATPNKNSEINHPEPPGHNHQLLSIPKVHVREQTPPAFMPSPWAMHEFLQLSDYESNNKSIKFRGSLRVLLERSSGSLTSVYSMSKLQGEEPKQPLKFLNCPSQQQAMLPSIELPSLACPSKSPESIFQLMRSTSQFLILDKLKQSLVSIKHFA